MREKEFDVLAPVDNKNLLSRAFWIIGSIVSMVLLAVSFCVESAVLSVLDVILPVGIILYGLIKLEKFPIYYYIPCLSGLYPIIWLLVIDNRDYSKEVLGTPTAPFVVATTFIACAAVLLVLFNFCIFPRHISLIKEKANKVSRILRLDIAILCLSLFAILGAQILNLNAICDKPYKTEWVCLQEIRHLKNKTSVYYMKQDSDYQYTINFNDYEMIQTYNWLYTDENGNEVFQIEYGNGALGIPWRRIV
ncbi:MAG: hypothetical protein IJZ75_06085 [Clostridia bacterium]|nr:hypothetical protein [Clostridia bacterium]